MALTHYLFSQRGLHLRLAGQPGVWSWDEVNPGTAALLEVAMVKPAERILDLGCGTGVLGAAAAVWSPQGTTVLVDSNVVAARCARATLEASGITNAEVQLGDGCSALEPGSFDRVLSHLPRERQVQEELLRGAAAVLRPGGTLVFVAHRQAGVRTAVDFARGLFGRCGVVRQKKGYHVAMAARPADRDYPLPEPRYDTHTVALDGWETTVVGKPGVFAWDRLDDGTRALVGAMEIEPAERVLDLGCGTGLAGVAAARRAPEGWVTLIDVDVRATTATRRTLAANGVANAEVHLSNAGANLPANEFDVVITNPPFHQGLAVERTAARRFIDTAARLLRPQGRLYLVANAFLAYQLWLEAAFERVQVAWEDRRYRVWEASRQKSADDSPRNCQRTA